MYIEIVTDDRSHQYRTTRLWVSTTYEEEYLKYRFVCKVYPNLGSFFFKRSQTYMWFDNITEQVREWLLENKFDHFPDKWDDEMKLLFEMAF